MATRILERIDRKLGARNNGRPGPGNGRQSMRELRKEQRRREAAWQRLCHKMCVVRIEADKALQYATEVLNRTRRRA